MSLNQPRDRVAANVRAEMARNKISQVKLAETLSVSQAAISRRLSGRVAFDIDELVRIAEAFNIPLAELVIA